VAWQKPNGQVNDVIPSLRDAVGSAFVRVRRPRQTDVSLGRRRGSRRDEDPKARGARRQWGHAPSGRRIGLDGQDRV
jgi:hypothetical protein